MLGLDTNQQAMYVGIRSTFYRIATIMGQGVLIILAGFLESSSGREPVVISIEASPQFTQTVLQLPSVVETGELEGDLRFIVDNKTLQMSAQAVNKDTLKLFINEITASNQDNGFVIKEQAINKKGDKKENWWTASVSQPLGNWIKNNFGEKREVSDQSDKAGNIAVVAVKLSKKPEPGKNIVLNTTQNKGDKSISIVQGERLTFNESNWNKPAYLVFQVDPKLSTTTTAEYKGLSGNIPFAWSITFFVLAGLFICFSFYHRIFLPKPESDTSRTHLTAKNILKEFSITFVSFFKKKQTGVALFFMLTFRFSEAQLLKLINPFLLDGKDIGGLGLTTGEVGLVYGTVGIIGLTLGGIIGGIAAAKGGLKKWLWPMTLSMLLTISTFLYLSFSQTDSLIIINICVFVEQFGYGFGFTAYMLYLIYYSDGEHKTAHYAICTGFMALGMMIPGMFAGWLQELLGYNHFFIWVMICSIVPIIAVSLLKINPEYGRKKESE
jgi:PAT family beta-lactamase induction signal transducer AmpG